MWPNPKTQRLVNLCMYCLNTCKHGEHLGLSMPNDVHVFWSSIDGPWVDKGDTTYDHYIWQCLLTICVLCTVVMHSYSTSVKFTLLKRLKYIHVCAFPPINHKQGSSIFTLTMRKVCKLVYMYLELHVLPSQTSICYRSRFLLYESRREIITAISQCSC